MLPSLNIEHLIPNQSSILPWDRRIRLVCDLGRGATVWTVALFSRKPPDYESRRDGTCLGIFREQKLESAVTNWNNTVDAQIHRMAISDAKRCLKSVVGME